MPSTADRLEELLILKDAQLQDAQQRNEELQRQLTLGVDWMLHEELDKEADRLPVPRLELRVLENGAHMVESAVRLVVLESTGRLSAVPLAYSKRSGGGVRIDAYPTVGTLPAAFVRELPGLVADLAFFTQQMELPAFVVLDAEHQYIVMESAPLVLEAVQA